MRVLELTLYLPCPIRCSYCPQDTLWKQYQGRSRMPLSDVESIVANLPKDVLVNLAGMSEPLVYSDFAGVLAVLNRHSRHYCLYSTFWGVDSIKWRALCDYPPDSVVLHVLSQETQVRPTLEQIKVIQSLVENPIAPLRILEFKPPVAEFSNLPNTERGCAHSRAGNLPRASFATNRGKIRCNVSSSEVFDQNVLLPNGDVILCCMDYGLTTVLGNLLEESYESIVCKENQQAQITRMVSGKTICRRCVYSKPKT